MAPFEQSADNVQMKAEVLKPQETREQQIRTLALGLLASLANPSEEKEARSDIRELGKTCEHGGLLLLKSFRSTDARTIRSEHLENLYAEAIVMFMKPTQETMALFNNKLIHLLEESGTQKQSRKYELLFKLKQNLRTVRDEVAPNLPFTPEEARKFQEQKEMELKVEKWREEDLFFKIAQEAMDKPMEWEVHESIMSIMESKYIAGIQEEAPFFALLPNQSLLFLQYYGIDYLIIDDAKNEENPKSPFFESSLETIIQKQEIIRRMQENRSLFSPEQYEEIQNLLLLRQVNLEGPKTISKERKEELQERYEAIRRQTPSYMIILNKEIESNVKGFTYGFTDQLQVEGLNFISFCAEFAISPSSVWSATREAAADIWQMYQEEPEKLKQVLGEQLSGLLATQEGRGRLMAMIVAGIVLGKGVNKAFGVLKSLGKLSKLEKLGLTGKIMEEATISGLRATETASGVIRYLEPTLTGVGKTMNITTISARLGIKAGALVAFRNIAKLPLFSEEQFAWMMVRIIDMLVEKNPLLQKQHIREFLETGIIATVRVMSRPEDRANFFSTLKDLYLSYKASGKVDEDMVFDLLPLYLKTQKEFYEMVTALVKVAKVEKPELNQQKFERFLQNTITTSAKGLFTPEDRTAYFRILVQLGETYSSTKHIDELAAREFILLFEKNRQEVPVLNDEDSQLLLEALLIALEHSSQEMKDSTVRITFLRQLIRLNPILFESPEERLSYAVKIQHMSDAAKGLKKKSGGVISGASEQAEAGIHQVNELYRKFTSRHR